MRHMFVVLFALLVPITVGMGQDSQPSVFRTPEDYKQLCKQLQIEIDALKKYNADLRRQIQEANPTTRPATEPVTKPPLLEMPNELRKFVDAGKPALPILPDGAPWTIGSLYCFDGESFELAANKWHEGFYVGRNTSCLVGGHYPQGFWSAELILTGFILDDKTIKQFRLHPKDTMSIPRSYVFRVMEVNEVEDAKPVKLPSQRPLNEGGIAGSTPQKKPNCHRMVVLKKLYDLCDYELDQTKTGSGIGDTGNGTGSGSGSGSGGGYHGGGHHR